MNTNQKTRMLFFLVNQRNKFYGILAGRWWQRSLIILSILVGFFAGNSLTVHMADVVRIRTFSALYTLLLCEILVQLRRFIKKLFAPLALLLVDNLRIGFVYAVILEAFKVGS